MARTKLIDSACEKLTAKGGKRTVYFDALVTGLALRVTVEGARTFCAVYRLAGDAKRIKRWMTIGRYLGPADDPMYDGKAALKPADGSTLTLHNAREIAKAALAVAASGRDPSKLRDQRLTEREERRQNTFGIVAEEFLKRHVAGLRSAKIAEGVVRRELLGQVQKDEKWTDDRRNPCWRDRPITEITRRDVVQLLEKVVDSGRPYLARLVLAYARKLFRWAIGRDMYGLETSPCYNVSAKEHGAPTVPRQVTLAPDHVRIIWKAAGELGEPLGAYLKMLLLSGQRRSEIARLQWSEINTAERVIVLPAERMKAKRPHEVPLSGAMCELLDGITRGKGNYVFSTTNGVAPISGFAKLKAKLDKKVAELHAEELKAAKETGEEYRGLKELPDWRLHDLRRTMRTGLGAIPEIAADVRELVIAHVSPALVRNYDLHSYRAEKREALELWARRLNGIAELAPAKEEPTQPHPETAIAAKGKAKGKVIELSRRAARAKRAPAAAATA